MTLREEQSAFLLDVCSLIRFIVEHGFEVTGGELFRTREQQKIYYNTGKSKTMHSNHLLRLAIDLNFFKDGELTYKKEDIQPIGEYWEGLHPKNKWGGNWKFIDMPHFERNI